MKNVLKTIIIGLVALLAGCGFHLRGEISVAPQMKNLYVQGISQYSDFGIELRRSLESQGITVAENPASASAILVLAKPLYNRRLLSVSAQSGKVAEYELNYSVLMSVKDREGKELLAPQEIRQLRDYTFDQNNVLGKSTEEARLRSDMESAIVRQVLNRLQSYSRG